MKKFLSMLCACAMAFSTITCASATSLQEPEHSNEPILISSSVTNEYDILVADQESAEGAASCNDGPSVEEILLERAQLPTDVLTTKYGYSNEDIAILKSYDGSPIEDNPQLRGIFADLHGYLYRMDYNDHGVTVRFSWNWEGMPVTTQTDVVTCAWVGVNSKNGPHALRFVDEESSFNVDYYTFPIAITGATEFATRTPYDINDSDVNSHVSAEFPMVYHGGNIWAQKGYMDVTLEEPVATNDLEYSTVVFAYGHEKLILAANLDVSIDGISISITPTGTTEKMWDGSISIWGNGYYESNGDAKPE